MYYLLFFQPYTYIKVNSDKSLFYNCLSNQLYIVTDTVVCTFLNNSHLEKEYTCKLSKKEMKHDSIMVFIENVRNYFMGDVIKHDYSEISPIIFAPKPKIQSEDVNFKLWDGTNLLDNLHELNIYTNGVESDNYLSDAYKQFIYPLQSNQELSFVKILDIFNNNEFPNLISVNIIGNHNYSSYDKLVKYFKDKNITKTLVLLSDDCVSESAILRDKNIIYEIILHMNSINEIDISNIINKYNNANLKLKLIVSTEEELKRANHYVEKFKVSNYELNPYFTGHNFDFFKDNVFLNTNDLETIELSIRDIMIKSKINPLCFGKLSILPNGNVHSNQNCPSLGNIESDSIKFLIMNEFEKSYSWTNSRNDKSECTNCVFNLLCPPLTNYEYYKEISKICNM